MNDFANPVDWMQLLNAEERYSDLDLEPIITLAADADRGYGWGLGFATAIALEYKRFLWLSWTYPDQRVVPSGLIDEIWRLHVADAAKYAADCQAYLGYFLPYFLHLGMQDGGRGDDRAPAMVETLALYRAHFGRPSAVIWLWIRR